MDGAKPFYRKTLTGWEPWNEPAKEFHRKYALGDTVLLEGRRPRNLAHHNKFWALMGLIADNSDYYPTARLVANAFLFGTGRYTEKHYPGYVHREPQSLSFANMDQTEFEAFYDEAMQYMITKVIPGLDRGELEDALMDFVT